MGPLTSLGSRSDRMCFTLELVLFGDAQVEIDSVLKLAMHRMHMRVTLDIVATGSVKG